jgi:hypothetical protein
VFFFTALFAVVFSFIVCINSLVILVLRFGKWLGVCVRVCGQKCVAAGIVFFFCETRRFDIDGGARIYWAAAFYLWGDVREHSKFIRRLFSHAQQK